MTAVIQVAPFHPTPPFVPEKNLPLRVAENW